MLVVIIAGCGGLAGEPAIVATMPVIPTRVPQAISLPQSAPDLALGAQIFAANCTRCHGVSGKGDGELVQSGQIPSLIDFTDPQVAQDAAPIAWYEVVTNGRLDKLMPPWGDALSDAERWAVTLYVYTLANTPEQIAEGQTIWADKCAECHGQAGEGADTAQGAPLPNLLEISTSEMLTALNEGIPDKMPPLADELSPEQRAAVAAYARTLSQSAAPQEVVDASATERAVAPPSATQEVGSETTVMGVVSGTVANLTQGGSVPPDLALNLHVISSDQTQAQTFDSVVNPDGSYRFENVPMQTGWQYVITTTYQGTGFSSDVAAADPSNPQLDIPLSLYEVTDNPASIQMNGVLMMLQTQPGALEVVEIVSFSNRSDRVFVQQTTGAPSSVSVRLPAGALFQDFSGGSYVVSADGTQVLDTQPVLPGDAHVMHIGYRLPYSGSANIDQAVDYPLSGQVEILVDNNAMSVTGNGLSQLGTRQLGDRAYVSYGGEVNRAVGESLRFDVNTAQTVQNSGGAGSNINIAYVLIGIGLLAIGAAFGFFMRERTDSRVRPGSDLLIEQIADLDLLYKEGKVAEASYQKQRGALKAQLAALMKDTPDKEKKSSRKK